MRGAREQRVGVPTLYVHGVDDGCIGLEVVEGQRRFFERGLTERRVEGAGHFVPLERPDAVADAILEHLRGD